MRILAIDPGPHVGMAMWNDEEPEAHRFSCWETTPEELYADIFNWISWVDVVVCEEFVIKGDRAREANVTIELIGVIKFICMRYGKTPVMQLPGEGLGFSTSEKLKRVGWWVRGGSDHGRAASKHLLLYCVKNGLIGAERVLESAS